MTEAIPMVEVWRGDILESLHRGHAVVCDARGEIARAWGDPEKLILPRSSCKMIQALPLIESGAADAFGLTPQHLALACASHSGAAIHTEPVWRWLSDIGLDDSALRCGPQVPRDPEARNLIYSNGNKPCQVHNNCSGKHTGFLTVSRHLRAGPEYNEPDHPVQIAVRDAFESVTGLTSPGYGIDGCSAPNFATTLHGLSRAMAFFATAGDGSVRGRAARRLIAAMTGHPELVAGEGKACTELMRALDGRAAIKTGAEGVFVAILPERQFGIALKIEDGTTRASECALASILVDLGVLDPDHPATLNRRNAPLRNRRGIVTGYIRPTDVF